MAKITITNDEPSALSEIRIKTINANGDPGGTRDVVLHGGESASMLVSADTRPVISEQSVAPVVNHPVLEETQYNENQFYTPTIQENK